MSAECEETRRISGKCAAEDLWDKEDRYPMECLERLEGLYMSEAKRSRAMGVEDTEVGIVLGFAFGFLFLSVAVLIVVRGLTIRAVDKAWAERHEAAQWPKLKWKDVFKTSSWRTRETQSRLV